MSELGVGEGSIILASRLALKSLTLSHRLVTLIEALLEIRVSRDNFCRLIYGINGDPSRQRLERRWIDCLCSHRAFWMNPNTPEKTILRRHWKVERSIRKLEKLRCIITWRERHPNLFH